VMLQLPELRFQSSKVRFSRGQTQHELGVGTDDQ
jgi:hypothetical protein